MAEVLLADCCFASAIGQTWESVIAHLRDGRSGIVSLQEEDPDSFLRTVARIPSDPGDEEEILGHPRLSHRFRCALGGFLRRTRALLSRTGPVEEVFVICRRPYLSDWRHPACRDWNDAELLPNLLDCLGIDLEPGRVCSLQASCSSGLVALNQACRLLLRGEARRVLVLAVGSEVVPEAFLSLKKLGALSPELDPGRSCQPFSQQRTGLVPGEVHVAVVLERVEPDQQQAGQILLEPGVTTSDAFRVTDGNEDGTYLEASLQGALRDRPPVDFVCPHATSTPLNDELEGRVLQRVFAGRPVWVAPLKQYVGHCLNNSGVWETVLTAGLLRHNFLPALLSQPPLDTYPDLRFPLTRQELPLRRALKLSIGFGGINSSLVLHKRS